MTAANQLTNITLAEAGDSGLWGDLGSGPGSGQDANGPVEGAENRARRIDNGVKGFSVGTQANNDLSAANLHFGMWVRTFQPGLTNILGLRASGDVGSPANSPYSQWNFPGSSYPIVGPWLRLWVEAASTPDTVVGTLLLSDVKWLGVEFDMGNVGGSSANCHIDRVDLGTVGIEISGAGGNFAQAETLDNTDSLGVLRDGILLAPIRLKNGTFSDTNFSIKAGVQPFAAADWLRIECDNTDAANAVTLGNYFLEGIALTVIGTTGLIDLGVGTLLDAPALTWNGSVTFAGQVIASKTLTSGGADLRGAKFDGSIDPSALIYDETVNPGTASGDLAGVSLKSAGTGHGVEFGINSPIDITLTEMDFTDYAVGDGSTGNEALWIRRTSGTVTITLDGTVQPSVRTDGATVVFVTGQIALTITGWVSGAILVIYDDDSADPQNMGTELQRNNNITADEVYSYPAGKAGDDIVIQLIATNYKIYQRTLTLAAAPVSFEILPVEETN